MIMIIEIIISIVMLFICVCVVYHYFVKQLNELESRILILEQRIENYKREYKQHFKKYKWLSEFNKKKVNKNEKF